MARCMPPNSHSRGDSHHHPAPALISSQPIDPTPPARRPHTTTLSCSGLAVDWRGTGAAQRGTRMVVTCVSKLGSSSSVWLSRGTEMVVTCVSKSVGGSEKLSRPSWPELPSCEDP